MFRYSLPLQKPVCRFCPVILQSLKFFYIYYVLNIDIILFRQCFCPPNISMIQPSWSEINVSSSFYPSLSDNDSLLCAVTCILRITVCSNFFRLFLCKEITAHHKVKLIPNTFHLKLFNNSSHILFRMRHNAA